MNIQKKNMKNPMFPIQKNTQKTFTFTLKSP